MKLSQLIEFNMGNVFLGQSYIKRGGETSPRHFSKNSKFSLSQNQQPEMLHSLLLLYVRIKES